MRLTPCSKLAAKFSSVEPAEHCSLRLLDVGHRDGRRRCRADRADRSLTSTLDGSAPCRDRSPSPGLSAGSVTPKSARPIRHASVIAVWELADRAAALAWLARNPELPDTEPDDDGGTCLATPKPPSPAPLAVALSQPTLF